MLESRLKHHKRVGAFWVDGELITVMPVVM